MPNTNRGRSKVAYDSPLIRKAWVTGKLVDCKPKSFFAPFTSKTFGAAPIYNHTQTNCKEGHTFVLDLKGKTRGGATEGSGCIDTTCLPRGVRFSEGLTARQYRWCIDNGNKFAECEIGNLQSTEHAESMDELGDNYTLGLDQARFDRLQGVDGNKPSYIFDAGIGLTYNKSMVLAQSLKTGRGFMLATKGGAVSQERAPRRAPFPTTSCGKTRGITPVIIDSYMMTALRLDPRFQTIMMHADVRGSANQLFTVQTEALKLGKLHFIEAPSYAGVTPDSGWAQLSDTVETAGLRRYAVLKNGSIVWEGTKAFEAEEEKYLNDPKSAKIYSRGLILGPGALIEGFGDGLDYTLDWGKHKKCSSSMLEITYNSKKTKLVRESGTCPVFKIAGEDYGVIAIDMLHTPFDICNGNNSDCHDEG